MPLNLHIKNLSQHTIPLNLPTKNLNHHTIPLNLLTMLQLPHLILSMVSNQWFTNQNPHMNLSNMFILLSNMFIHLFTTNLFITMPQLFITGRIKPNAQDVPVLCHSFVHFAEL